MHLCRRYDGASRPWAVAVVYSNVVRRRGAGKGIERDLLHTSAYVSMRVQQQASIRQHRDLLVGEEERVERVHADVC
jgi:hypothetical protein